jgi:fibronectin type 3 domain-containing protein
VNLFYARNIEEGILVSLPAVEYENRKQYVVYRREATEKDFSKIGTLNGNQYSFTDKAVKEGKVYVYSIGVVTTDNREGAKGKSISVRRKK